jgi:polygalacturonase
MSYHLLRAVVGASLVFPAVLAVHADAGLSSFDTVAALAAATTAASDPCTGQVLDVTAFGAVGDGKFNCTAAINAAISCVRQLRGGTVYFPNGTWFTAPFNVTTNATLYLSAGATLLASTLMSDWPVIAPLPSYGQGRDHPGPRRASFVHGVNVSNVVITGANGTIDGQGSVWWADHKSGKEVYTRGHLVEMMWGQNITISNLFLTNSPFWTVHPVSESEWEGVGEGGTEGGSD